ncbi:MAG: hypothetical protein MUF83_13945 [Acidimicrobiales bacterium]|nr:hypothetical protein [Acidimicrobiales bacterium]
MPDPEEASDERLRDLELAEERRASGERLDRRFELFEALLLSIAAILAAWAGFQSAKWSGDQAEDDTQAAARRVEASEASTLAGQQAIADLITFNQWLAAGEREGLLDTPVAEGQPYEPDPTLLSGFLYERFRPEFKVAVDAWLATEPQTNPDAAPTPFAMPDYQLAAEARAVALTEEARLLDVEARRANERSDNYLLLTIVLAAVLFFAGISSKMDTLRARLLLLGVGATLLVGSAVVVLAFPKDL